MPAGPGDITLLYRAAYGSDVAFRKELVALAEQRGLQFHILVGPEIGTDQTDQLGIPALQAMLPDLASRDVYVCWPPAMVDAIRRRLRALHVPRNRVHFERFAY